MSGRRQVAGFTLTELVIIIVIVGALAVFAAPRLNIGGFDSASFRQEVVNALRFAQKTAAASRCPVRVNLDADKVSVLLRANGTATSCGDGDFDEPLRHPSRGGDFVIKAEREAGITAGKGDIEFDSRGEFSPGDGNNQTITFSGGSSVTVVAGTGYIDA